MSEIPVQLAMIAASPALVSMLLLTLGLLLPGCPCCDDGDDCGQDVYGEVYVTYSGIHQVTNELRFGILGYIDQPFPEHWYAPLTDINNSNSEGFFFFGNTPFNEDNSGRGATNSAPVYYGSGIGTGYSIATSGSVACINIGRTQNAVYPDRQPGVVGNLWRYVFNANYGGLGCESNGVDVVVMPTCPGLTAGLDRWTVSCYWCAGTRSQLFSHGNSSTPTAPRIPSTAQRNQERVTLIGTGSLFPGFDQESGFRYAIPKSELQSQGSVPALPSPHELPTEETIGTVWSLGAIITTEFNFNSQPKQATTLNASIRFPRPDYLVDATATIATGGSTLVNKLNPCSGSSCPTQFFGSQLTTNNFWNSSWQAYVRPGPQNGFTNKLVSFFEIAEPPASWNMSDYYVLKPLAEYASNTLQPIGQGGAFTPTSTTSSAQITLDFP